MFSTIQQVKCVQQVFSRPRLKTLTTAQKVSNQRTAAFGFDPHTRAGPKWVGAAKNLNNSFFCVGDPPTTHTTKQKKQQWEMGKKLPRPQYKIRQARRDTTAMHSFPPKNEKKKSFEKKVWGSKTMVG